MRGPGDPGPLAFQGRDGSRWRQLARRTSSTWLPRPTQAGPNRGCGTSFVRRLRVVVVDLLSGGVEIASKAFLVRVMRLTYGGGVAGKAANRVRGVLLREGRSTRTHVSPHSSATSRNTASSSGSSGATPPAGTCVPGGRSASQARLAVRRPRLRPRPLPRPGPRPRHRARDRPPRHLARHWTGHLPLGRGEDRLAARLPTSTHPLGTQGRHPRSLPQTRLLPDHSPTTRRFALPSVEVITRMGAAAMQICYGKHPAAYEMATPCCSSHLSCWRCSRRRSCSAAMGKEC